MKEQVRIRYLGCGKPEPKTGRFEKLEAEVNKFIEVGEELVSITPCVFAISTQLTGIRPANGFAVVTKIKRKQI